MKPNYYYSTLYALILACTATIAQAMQVPAYTPDDLANAKILINGIKETLTYNYSNYNGFDDLQENILFLADTYCDIHENIWKHTFSTGIWGGESSRTSYQSTTKSEKELAQLFQSNMPGKKINAPQSKIIITLAYILINAAEDIEYCHQQGPLEFCRPKTVEALSKELKQAALDTLEALSPATKLAQDQRAKIIFPVARTKKPRPSKRSSRAKLSSQAWLIRIAIGAGLITVAGACCYGIYHKFFKKKKPIAAPSMDTDSFTLAPDANDEPLIGTI